MQSFLIGSSLTASVAFTNKAGAAADPGAVTLTVETLGAAATTYIFGQDGILVKDAVGAYHADETPTRTGERTYRWVGTDPVAAVVETTVYIAASAIT